MDMLYTSIVHLFDLLLGTIHVMDDGIFCRSRVLYFFVSNRAFAIFGAVIETGDFYFLVVISFVSFTHPLEVISHFKLSPVFPISEQCSLASRVVHYLLIISFYTIYFALV